MNDESVNEHPDGPETDPIDPQLSAHYQQLAAEVAPAELDRKVLQIAGKAAGPTGWSFSFMAVMRPAVFVATAGLSLVLLLELNDSGIDVAPMATEMSPQAVPDSLVSDDATDERSAIETTNAPRREKSQATTAAKIAAPGTASSEFNQATQTSRGLIAATLQEPATSGDANLARESVSLKEARSAQRVGAQGVAESLSRDRTIAENNPPSTGHRPRPDLPQLSYDAALTTLEAPPPCSQEQKSDTDQWWSCIGSLRRAGMTELASSELESLHEKFPNFVAPK
jgi:hypothetical protein